MAFKDKVTGKAVVTSHKSMVCRVDVNVVLVKQMSISLRRAQVRIELN